MPSVCREEYHDRETGQIAAPVGPAANGAHYRLFGVTQVVCWPNPSPFCRT